ILAQDFDDLMIELVELIAAHFSTETSKSYFTMSTAMAGDKLRMPAILPILLSRKSDKSEKSCNATKRSMSLAPVTRWQPNTSDSAARSSATASAGRPCTSTPMDKSTL